MIYIYIYIINSVEEWHEKGEQQKKDFEEFFADKKAREDKYHELEKACDTKLEEQRLAALRAVEEDERYKRQVTHEVWNENVLKSREKHTKDLIDSINNTHEIQQQIYNQLHDPMLAELQRPEDIMNRAPGQSHRVRVDMYKGWNHNEINQLYQDQEQQRLDDIRRAEEQARKDRELNEALEEKCRKADEERRRKDYEKQLAMRENHFEMRAQARLDKLKNRQRNQDIGKNVIYDSFFNKFGTSCR